MWNERASAGAAAGVHNLLTCAFTRNVGVVIFIIRVIIVYVAVVACMQPQKYTYKVSPMDVV